MFGLYLFRITLLGVALSSISPVAAQVIFDKELIQKAESDSVIVTGYGESPQRALNDAYRRAVEQTANTTFVFSETEVSNNELTKDDVLVHSRGFIDSWKIVEEGVRDGLRFATIKATVNADRYFRTAKGKGIQLTRQVADVEFKQNQKDSASAILARKFQDYGPERFYDVSIAGQPEVEKIGAQYQVSYELKMTVNETRWLEFHRELIQTFRNLGIASVATMSLEYRLPRESKSLHVANPSFCNALTSNDWNSRNVYAKLETHLQARGDDWGYCLFVPNSFAKQGPIKFNTGWTLYHLPSELTVKDQLAKRSYQVKLMLTDSEDRIVAEKECPLVPTDLGTYWYSRSARNVVVNSVHQDCEKRKFSEIWCGPFLFYNQTNVNSVGFMPEATLSGVEILLTAEEIQALSKQVAFISEIVD